MAKKNKAPEPNITDVERLTFEAMRHCGMIPPMTITDVENIEANLEKIELPFGPKDPFELLQKLDGDGDDERRVDLVVPLTSGEQCISRNRALAARKGSEISEEVERRMAEDKARHLQNGCG